MEWAALYEKLERWLRQQGVTSQQQWFHALALARSRTFAAPATPLPLARLALPAAALQLAVVAAAVTASVQAAVGLEVAGAAALAGAVAWVRKAAETQQQYALCPLIDLINHTSSCQVSGHGAPDTAIN